MSYSAEKVDEVLAIVDTGLSHSEVSRQTGIPQVTISRWARDRLANPPETPTPQPTPEPPIPQKIALASLCLTAGTQMRVQLNLATIAEYAADMEDGAKFPPVVVFSDGETFWLGDGFQRVKAADLLGYVEIAADIRSGTLRDAILFACGANAHHGERRTNADKRKSVLTLLRDAEWSQLSDRRIADICGVTHPFVADVRKSLVTVVTVTTSNYHDETNTRQYVDKHGTTTTMDTSNIGRRATVERKSRPEVQSSPVQQSDVGIMFDDVPSPSCATCAEVVTLIDDALSQLNTSGYLDCEQILLTVRRLVMEKTAVQDA